MCQFAVIEIVKFSLKGSPFGILENTIKNKIDFIYESLKFLIKISDTLFKTISSRI